MSHKPLYDVKILSLSGPNFDFEYRSYSDPILRSEVIQCHLSEGVWRTFTKSLMCVATGLGSQFLLYIMFNRTSRRLNICWLLPVLQHSQAEFVRASVNHPIVHNSLLSYIERFRIYTNMQILSLSLRRPPKRSLMKWHDHVLRMKNIWKTSKLCSTQTPTLVGSEISR